MSATGGALAVRPPDASWAARILIVDDEPANTTILDRLLRQAGYVEVVLTNDSAQAVRLYEEFRPDIVLLDLHMPPPDGYEILRRLADPDRESVRPPVVVLTADATRAARERALGLGATDFLTKPLDHLEVLLRIRGHLATRFLELELLGQNAELEVVVAERTASLRASLEQLRATADERRRLSAALVSAQEQERRRIAADVHDGAVQALVALGMRLELVARNVSDEAARSELGRLRATLAVTLGELRDLIFRLTPASLERDGLAAGLRESLGRLRTAHGPVLELEDGLTAEPPGEVAVVLYRIAQEALVNALRHARAKRVAVTLAPHGDGISLAVTDDGRGFELPADGSLPTLAGHLGLPSMRERAELAGGWLRIASRPGAGATITAWVPVEPRGEDDGRA